MGKGKKPLKSVFPHVVGSEKSMSFTMMLSKVFKVAIEHVQATPLRWPTCILTLSQVTVKRGCLKMQKGAMDNLMIVKQLANDHFSCKTRLQTTCAVILLFHFLCSAEIRTPPKE